MRDRYKHEDEDRAVLLELMARAFDAAGGEPPEAIRSAVGRDDAVKLRMNSLMRGRIEPATDADRAALAILQPGPDDSEPATESDRAAMEACPTCGGERYVNGWHLGEIDATPTVETCPPPPDGCGGTGRRNGK